MNTPKASLKFSSMRLWNWSISAAPSSENVSLDFLYGKFAQVLFDDVPDMFKVDGKRQDFHRSLGFALVKIAPCQFRQISLSESTILSMRAIPTANARSFVINAVMTCLSIASTVSPI